MHMIAGQWSDSGAVIIVILDKTVANNKKKQQPRWKLFTFVQ